VVYDVRFMLAIDPYDTLRISAQATEVGSALGCSALFDDCVEPNHVHALPGRRAR
jgi:hypothetical protein